jgi:uncharacterized protein (DUF1499 family)
MENEPETSNLITNDDSDKQIWIDDFCHKQSILDSKYAQVSPEILYAAVMGSIDAPCTLLIKELLRRKVRIAKNYGEVVQCCQEYKNVLFYAKEFNKTSSVGMRFVVHLNALIIDIDEVRSHNIGVALAKIDACPVKPNYIVSSGNGLHLYYVLNEKFDFMNYTCGMAIIRQVKRVVVTGKKPKKYKISTADKIKDVYSAMIGWVDDISYKVDKLHLAHGIRMFGGKTKNPTIMSVVYKCSDEMYDLETLAEITGVELFTAFEQLEFDRLHNIVEDNSDVMDASESEDDGGDVDGDGYDENDLGEEEVPLDEASIPRKRVKFDWTAITEQIKANKNLRPTRRPVPKWAAYTYLVSAIKENFKVGIRNNCLFIMCCKGRHYQIPENIVKQDLLNMVECMNAKDPDDIITPAGIEKAFSGFFSRHKYKNETITEITGIVFGRKQKELRSDSRLIKKADCQAMLVIVTAEYSLNPKISLRELSDALKLRGIKRGRTFLSSDSDVVKIRDKYRA